MSEESDSSAHPLTLDEPVGDSVHASTCYMCACRCGIHVHLRDGMVRYIEGNPEHPVNQGVICAKGSAGALNHHSPARLTAPLLRTGPRGSGEFRTVSWEEAIETALAWLAPVRSTNPAGLAFFTGRDQSQALTGWWASQFGTPNHAAHGGFCSVNMAAGGLYTIGGSFWEFGEPDWERTRLVLLFGVAEDHDSNPLKRELGALKSRGGRLVSVNPVRTGYSAIADEWIPVRPGTDGLLVLALVHELLRSGRVDAEYLARWTNASWLVIDDPEGPEDGLFARDARGTPLAADRVTGALVPAPGAERPALRGRHALEDGTGRHAVPVFERLAARYLEPRYAPESVAEATGVSATRIRRLAAEIADTAFESPVSVEQPWTDAFGKLHPRMTGRPVAFHAMRGISAHANGFHTCRALHLLQTLLGTIDAPGGFRYRPPFPRPAPPPQRPAGRMGEVRPGEPLPGPPLGFPAGPEDLLVDGEGKALRVDKAFSWEAPLAAHGMMHTVIANAARGDPYPIDVLFMYMANMAWNSAMNVPGTLEALTATDPETGEYRIPRIIYSDAYASETVAYADLVLPDTTYLERWDCISLLDRPISSAEGPADAIRQPVVAPERDVRPFQDVLLELGARLGLPGLVDGEGRPRYPGGYRQFLVEHEYRPGVGSLAGWRGRDGGESCVGAPNPEQLERYVENGCFWQERVPPEAAFYRHVNRAYLDYAHGRGFIGAPDPMPIQLWSEPLQRFRLAARGHGPVQPPEAHRARIERYFDPLPIWYDSLELDSAPGQGDGGGAGPSPESPGQGESAHPLHAITQRPMAMYHSWGSHNAWLRQIHGENPLYVSPWVAARAGVADGEWAWVEAPGGRRIRVRVRIMDGVERHTVWTWNAIGKRAGAWNLPPGAPEANRGFLLNHLIPDLLPPGRDGHRYPNADPVTGQGAWYDLRVRLRRDPDQASPRVEPRFERLRSPPGLRRPAPVLRFAEKRAAPAPKRAPAGEDAS